MAEENKNIRLNKVAREFNVGITTLVEYLAKKGHKIENNPNTKIDEVMFNLLAKEFQSEKNVKETAQKIGLDYPGRVPVTLENIEKTAESALESEGGAELLIKNVPNYSTAEKPKEKVEETPKVVETVVEEKPIAIVEKPVVIEEVIAKAEPEIIEQVIAEPIVVETVVAEPIIVETVVETIVEIVKEVPAIEIIEEKTPVVEEPIAVKEPIEEPIVEAVVETIAEEIEVPQEIEEVEETEEGQENKLKVIGKIDLSKLNQKTKPDKVSKEEKKKFIKEKLKREKEELRPQQRTQENKVEAPIETPKEIVNEKPIDLVLPVKEEAAPSPVVTPAEPRQDNFYETKYEKLEGPKVINKIDLQVFKKPPILKKQPVATSSDPKKQDKKRPRIKDEKVIPPKTHPAPVLKTAGANGPHPPKNPDAKKPPLPEKRGRFKVIKAVKPEVSDNEIEKQIKETLARLSPTGKSKSSKYRREKRQQVSQQNQEDLLRNEEGKKIIKVTEFVTANELASMMDVPVTSVISTCMNLGMFVSINQRLDAEALNIVADEFGFSVDFVSVEVLEAITEAESEDNPEDLIERAPIVTVMGHVDHGKTSLLDYIRNTNVIAGEAGGITQHIGAYEVELENGRKITFLDTPGHEAFTAMRARGAKITDVAIIVVAADDKIMPQTIEAINHVQAAGVPVVFAINKIDKSGANPEKIKEELANMNILVEDWGGKYQSQDISAKKGINVDHLLEKVLLEAELLDLKGNPKKNATGTVIESSLDKGRGYVAKILIQNGSIKIGDVILAGANYGKVKAMYNERNQLIKYAGPSTPILLLGLNGAPQAGDKCNVMDDEREAKDISNKRLQLQREQGIRTQKHITLDEIGRRIAIGDFKQLNIIVKGDVDGSVEALSDSLLKLSSQEVQVNIIHKSVGQITESDILLASASDAVVIGFQVRPSMSARKLAEAEQIDVRLYSIIYNAINELKAAIEGMLAPDIEEKIICNIEIREVFKITKVGTIAGCMVLDGKITRNTKIRIIRDGIVVYTGRLGSLKRFKDDVKEVSTGYECGLNIDNFNDIKVGDIVEGYEEIEIKRKL